MKRFSEIGVRRRWFAVAAGAAALVGAAPMLTAGASAAGTPSTGSVSRIAKNGLGKATTFKGPNLDSYAANTYAWSMSWFKGKLYVGTGQHEICIERAISDYYFPDQDKYSTQPVWHTYCPADKFDIKAQGQIWTYTPATHVWRLVYQAPNVTIPNGDLPAADQNKGKTIGAQVGFRGMAVYNNVLYAAGVTADEYLPNLRNVNRAPIMRSTDGVHWTNIGGPATVSTPYGVQQPVTWRSLAVWNNHLYGNTGGGFTGDGALVRIDNPESSATFTQVSAPDKDVYELQTYNGQLYVGLANKNGGYAVSRTQGSDTSWKDVVVFGAGRGAAVNSVVAMGIFGATATNPGYLFVGGSGWYAAKLSSEMIRVGADDRFQLITGTTRTYNFPGDSSPTTLAPLSGLGDGFGNPFTAHFWRFGSIAGGLYVTTNDWSWDFWNVPVLRKALKGNFGFDTWGTCDGVNWKAVSTNAFGDGLYNFGGRTLQTSGDGKAMYIGSVNSAQGFSVWKTGDMMGCSAAK